MFPRIQGHFHHDQTLSTTTAAVTVLADLPAVDAHPVAAGGEGVLLDHWPGRRLGRPAQPVDVVDPLVCGSFYHPELPVIFHADLARLAPQMLA